MKDKNFKNYLEKNNNLSESTLFLREYGYQLINKFVNLDEKINEFKKLDEPDEEMEELLQDWVNHLVKNPPKNKSLVPIVLKQYANAVNAYLKYHRFRIDIKNLKFPNHDRRRQVVERPFVYDRRIPPDVRMAHARRAEAGAIG